MLKSIGQRFEPLGNDTSRLVLKRLGEAIITLLLASALSFAIMQLAPGNYLDNLKADPQISLERLQELERQFGLDKSPVEQYLHWLWQMIRYGNFGTSFVYQRSVASLLWERVPATLLLSVSSILLTWGLAIPLGIWAAVTQDRWAIACCGSLATLAKDFPVLLRLCCSCFWRKVRLCFP